ILHRLSDSIFFFIFFFFFFQAEDGIRDRNVTGVQTCALPILLKKSGLTDPFEEHRKRPLTEHLEDFRRYLEAKDNTPKHARQTRSEERRVGKEWRDRWWRDH